MQQSSVRIAAFGAGIWATTFLPILPDIHYLAAIFLIGLLLLRLPRLEFASLFILGVAWHIHYGTQILAAEIPEAWQQRELQIEGVIRDIPRQTVNADGSIRRRFDLLVEQVTEGGRPLVFFKPLTVRLSWYQSQVLQANQRWRFKVVLQGPRSLINPGGFDYRIWLLARGIGASGKVVGGNGWQLPGQGQQWLSALRQWYHHRLLSIVPPIPVEAMNTGSLLAALAIGDKQGLSKPQRQILAATGTAHLMVISGLHIGLCALLGHYLGFIAASIRPGWVQAGIALRVAGFTSVGLAVIYAALAGFTIPTQRALILVGVYVCARQLSRRLSSQAVLMLALALVLLRDPLAVTDTGFWLSFTAVFILMTPLPRRYGQRSGLRVASIQMRLLLAMLPAMALLLGQSSVLAPFVNLLAIPLLAFTIVPVLLAALIVLPLWPSFGSLLLKGVAVLLQNYWLLLENLAGWSKGWSIALLYPTTCAIGVALVGFALYLLPRGLPGRAAWPLLVIPLLWPKSMAPSALDVYVLDVGQGTAVLVQTRNHILLYDAGPAYEGAFDAGEAVVLPFLRSRGIDRIDKLVISHGDNDHSGGASSVMAAVTVDEWLAPRPVHGMPLPGDYCRSGMLWNWDGVDFEFLHPPQTPPVKSNNSSCVLAIRGPERSYLLAGDIERSVEAQLVARYGPALRSDVLLVPHHGSKSSSSYDFAWFTRPGLAVASAGHDNRFGHPAAPVVQRYRDMGVELLTTSTTGALHFTESHSYRPYRWFYTRYWQHYPCRGTRSASKSWYVSVFSSVHNGLPGCDSAAASAEGDGILW